MQKPRTKDEAAFTMAEAAKLKGVSYHTVSRAIRKQVIPSTRIGRQVLIRESDLAAWAPLVERRPKKWSDGRTPDLGVRPVASLPGTLDNRVATRMIERMIPILARLGSTSAAESYLQEILVTLASALRCRSAAIIAWQLDDDIFEVRATTGEERDWLSSKTTNIEIMSRPLRLNGHALGLFAGVPNSDYAALDAEDEDVVSALMTLAAIALAYRLLVPIHYKAVETRGDR